MSIVAKLKAVATAAFNLARARLAAKAMETETVKALRALPPKADQSAVRHNFMMGYIAAGYAKSDRSNSDGYTHADYVLRAANYGRKAKAGQATRTKDEQDAYNNAKQAYSALLKAHGIASTQKKGGKRGVKRKVAKVAKVAKPAPIIKTVLSRDPTLVPAAPTGDSARKWLIEEAAIIDAFASKNSTVLGTNVLQLIVEFRNAIKAALAK